MQKLMDKRAIDRSMTGRVQQTINQSKVITVVNSHVCDQAVAPVQQQQHHLHTWQANIFMTQASKWSTSTKFQNQTWTPQMQLQYQYQSVLPTGFEQFIDLILITTATLKLKQNLTPMQPVTGCHCLKLDLEQSMSLKIIQRFEIHASEYKISDACFNLYL